MAWSGGTFTRTNGVNSGATVWTTDAAASVKIRADRHDTHDQDLATGINQCINKDGSNTATQLNVDNLRLDGNTVSSTNTNGDINLSPNGTGSVVVSTDIELGHASDTTLTRPAAGRVQVEGREVVTAAADATVMTTTIAELNRQDESLYTTANHTRYVATFLQSDGTAASLFNVGTNITEGTFESIGPTGSSATNTYTAMDNIPTNATFVVFLALLSGQSSAASVMDIEIFGRPTGSTIAAGNGTYLLRLRADPDAASETFQLYSLIYVPLDSSRRCDITWNVVDGTESINICYRGYCI
jgi:hypothetical protein